MGIKHLKVIVDFNLVVCQAKESFSLKEPCFAPYRTLAQKRPKENLRKCIVEPAGSATNQTFPQASENWFLLAKHG